MNAIATRKEMAQDSLDRATQGTILINYPTIFEGFSAKGIPQQDILPRENVFTFWAWKGKGRSVKKGEHGVKVVTWITKTEEKDGKQVDHKFPKTAVVFHESQTEVQA